jgi:iron complex outermembrane receptor protein
MKGFPTRDTVSTFRLRTLFTSKPRWGAGLMRMTVAIAVACLIGGMAIADDAAASIRKNISIPPQELKSALQALATDRDFQILYRTEVVGDRRTGGAVGELNMDEVLTRLLTGTGLTYQYLDDKTITITPVGAAAPKAATPPSDAAKGEEKSSFWSRFRVARADQGSAAGDVPLATSSESSTQSDSASTRLEEVVVTAQKRAQSIMSVPVSISALTASSIAQRGLVNAEDYLRTVPAVAYINQGPGQEVVVIRGSYGDAFATAPTVGRYLGDIPLTGLALGSSVDIKLVDMERVEVLRGPQGTLYGSNSLSGTIRNIPAAPDLGEFESRVTVGYSSTAREGGDNGEIQGVVNIPLIADRLAIRAVAYRFQDSGFVRNVAGDVAALQASAAFFGQTGQAGNENEVGDTTTTGGRVAALWKPIDSLEITFNYVRQDDAAADRPFAQRGFPEYQRAVYQFGPVVGDSDALKIKLDIKNLTVDYQTRWGSFLSSTSIIEQDYRRLWQLGSFYPVSGFIPSIPQDSVTRARSVTEEARFTSSFDLPLQLIAGVFYEDSEQPTTQIAYYSGDPARNPFTVVPGTALGTPRGPNQLYGGDIDRATKQLAGFGEVSYAVTPELKLTAGMRQFHYDFKFASAVDAFTINSSKASLGSTFVDSRGESGQTYMASVEFTPTTSSLLYGKFSQGFRLGRPKNISQVETLCDIDRDGLIDGTSLSATDPLIHSDNLDSYELGAKVSMLEGRASLSIAGYHNNWNDIPVTIRPTACPGVAASFNVGKVRVDGIELEGGLRPIDAVAIDFGVGYVNSRLAETTPLGPKGAQMNYTPKWNGHFGAEYGVNFNGRRTYVRGDYSYYGAYSAGLGNTGNQFDSYGLFDLSLGMRFEQADLRLFADNVTNKYAVSSDIAFPSNGIFPVRPRTVGLRIGFSF